MIAVLAGNREQFDRFLRDREVPQLYRYIRTREHAYGMHFTEIIVLGTFWERADAGEIHTITKTRIRK